MSMHNIIAAAAAAAIVDGVGKVDSDPSRTSGNDIKNKDNNTAERLILTRMQKENNTLRRGKWTVEEEAYSTRLIQEFRNGLLPISDGTTLRTFLSIMLNCDPMRISKKFTGGNCIGKQVFKKCKDAPDPKQIEKNNKELAELEQQYMDRITSNNTGSKSPSSTSSLHIVGSSVSSTRRSRLNQKVEQKNQEAQIKNESDSKTVKTRQSAPMNKASRVSLQPNSVSDMHPCTSSEANKCVELSPLFNVTLDEAAYSENKGMHKIKMEDIIFAENIPQDGETLKRNSSPKESAPTSASEHSPIIDQHQINNTLKSMSSTNEEMPRVQSLTFLPYGILPGSSSIQDLAMLLGNNINSPQPLQGNSCASSFSALETDHVNDNAISKSIPSFFKEASINECQRRFSPPPNQSISHNSSVDDFRSLLKDYSSNEYNTQFINNSSIPAGYSARSFYLPGQGAFMPPKSVGQLLPPYQQMPSSQYQFPFTHANPFNGQRYFHVDPYAPPYLSRLETPLAERANCATRHSMGPPSSVNNCPLHFIHEEMNAGCDGVNVETKKDSALSSDESLNEINMVRQNSKRYAEFEDEEEERSQRVKTNCGDMLT